MPRDDVCFPTFTDSFVGAMNAKNTRRFRVKSKGKTQDTNTHNMIHVRIFFAWLERTSPIESPRERDCEVELLGERSGNTGQIARNSRN